MANYEGESCAKCGKAFQPGDDIVVCPDCGAPYHRSCIKNLKECVYHDKHGTDEAYKSKAERDREQQEAQAKKVDGRGELRCSRCGTVNPVDGLFCEVCGTPLKKQVEEQAQQAGQACQNGQQGGQTPPPFGGFGPFSGGGAGQQPYNTIPYNPFTTPFGGLNADEEIDGVPVKDLAIFLGQNSHYFLPKFKQMKERNNNTWNWSAFFLQSYYLLYRRVNWLGILVFCVQIMFMLPSFLVSYDQIRQLLSPDIAPVFDQNMMLVMSSVFSFIAVGLRCFLGMFFNRIYMNQTLRKIKKLKEQYGDTAEYHAMLMKNGSVTIKTLAVVLVLMMATWIAYVFIVMLAMV